LWHGANWTFVVWGGLHGLLLAVERPLGIGADARAPQSMAAWLGAGLRLLVTFHLVVFCWIFFRAADVGSAFTYIAGIARLSGLDDIGWMPLGMGLALLLIDVPQFLSGQHTALARVPWWIRSPVYAGVCLLTLGRLLWGGDQTPFIYFQF
jgi:hypothetical protein